MFAIGRRFHVDIQNMFRYNGFMNRRQQQRSGTWGHLVVDTLMVLIVGVFVYMLAAVMYVL